MMKIALLSLTPLYLPAACRVAGCECQGICSAFNAAGCVVLAGLAAAAIFVALSAVSAFRRLGALRD